MRKVDPLEIGLEGVIDVLRQIVVENFFLNINPKDIDDNERIFEEGLGLNSLQGIELLVQIEDCFNLRVNDVDWSIHEAQTLLGLGKYILVWAEGEAY